MDETLLLLVNGWHSAYWDEFMWMLTYRFTWIPLYIAIAYAVVRTVGWKRGLLFVACVGLTTLIADQVGSHVIRPWAERLRPSNLDNPLSAMIHIVHDYRGAPYGMPSCHAANTVGLLTIVCWQFRNRLLTSMLMLWMLSQIYSRMYLGVHYPTDLLVGAFIGVCSGTLMAWMYRTGVKKWIHGDGGKIMMSQQNAMAPVSVFLATLVVIAVLSISDFV